MIWDFTGMTSSEMPAKTALLATLHLDQKLPSFNAHFYDTLLVQLQEWMKFLAVRRWRFLFVCLFIFLTLTWCKAQCLWTTLCKICKVLTKKTDLWILIRDPVSPKQNFLCKSIVLNEYLKNGLFLAINLTLLGNVSTFFECKYQGQI